MKRFVRQLFIPAVLFLSFSQASLAREIAVADLPQAVTQAIQKAHPGAQVIKADQSDKDGRAEKYEVRVKLADGKERKVTVSPSGQIMEDKD